MHPQIVAPTTATPATGVRRPWGIPQISELPRLSSLTLASAIGGGGGTSGGGSTVFTLLLAAGLAFGASACSTDRTTGPGDGEVAPRGVAAALTCRADRIALTIDCQPMSDGPAAAPGQEIIGDQGRNIGMRSMNVSYDDIDLLSADITVENLTSVPLGTLDGTTKSSGIRVFVFSGPVAFPTGTVTMNNPTSTGTITDPNQSYYLYDVLLPKNQITAPMTWEFKFAGGATDFIFSVLVAADIPSQGGMLRWTTELGFGPSKWRHIAGWGTDGLVLFGDDGEVMIRNGGGWHPRPDPLTGNPTSVPGDGRVGGDLLNIVNEGGDHLRYWDGSGWRSIEGDPNGPGSSLQVVGFASTVGAYVFGSGFRVHGTNEQWTDLSASLSTVGGNISAATDVNGEILGYAPSSGRLWLYHNAVWQAVTGAGCAGVGGNPRSLLAPDTAHVWVFSPNDATALCYWRNGTWTPISFPGVASDIVGVSAGDSVTLFATQTIGGTSGNLIRWRASTNAWDTIATNAGANAQLWARNADEIFGANATGGVAMWDSSGNFEPLAHDTTMATMVAVWVNSPTEAYLTSSYGSLFRFDGTAWFRFDSAATNGSARPVWSSGPNDVWRGLGDDEVRHWDGVSWTTMDPGAAGAVTGFAGEEDDVWAVTSQGNVIHWNGAEWGIDPVASGLTSNLNAIWMLNANFGFAVGDQGKILIYNGIGWALSPTLSGSTTTMYAVSGSSPTNAWVVGNNGEAHYWDGADWTQVSTGGGQPLKGVWVRGVDDAYAVGQTNTLIAWNGTSWLQQGILGLPNQNYVGIWGSGDLSFIVGTKVLRGGR